MKLAQILKVLVPFRLHPLKLIQAMHERAGLVFCVSTVPSESHMLSAAPGT
jgi:hypothetical protein